MVAMGHDLRLHSRETSTESVLAYMAGFIWTLVRKNVTTLRWWYQLEPGAPSHRLHFSFLELLYKRGNRQCICDVLGK